MFELNGGIECFEFHDRELIGHLNGYQPLKEDLVSLSWLVSEILLSFVNLCVV